MKLFYNIFIILIVSTLYSKIYGDSKNIDLEQIIFRFSRKIIMLILNDTTTVYKQNLLEGKAQSVLNKSQEFFCNTEDGRSKTPPNSIHQLRPGDIDIIGAIGDSLSSANGGISNRILNTGREYRGIAFSGGGYRNWRKFITLPNILKNFNPNLYGYATDDSITMDRRSKFNVAEPMLMSADTYYSATVLVKRMELDPIVNMTYHWKVITIFIGSLDFCIDSCLYSTIDEFVNQHEKELVKTLRYLRDRVPRLLINLISIPNILALKKITHISAGCNIFVPGACPCIFRLLADEQYNRKALNMWQQRHIDISNRDEFNKEDFIIIPQPFLNNLTLPFDNEGDWQVKILATDCFHFSQVGHAYAAIGLWNNMLQPMANKSTTIHIGHEHFLCPSKEFPFIITKKNSPKLWEPNVSEIAKKLLPNIL